MIGLLSMITSAYLVPTLCEERGPFRHSPSHLTARTLTGERSVDLNRITTVRLLTTFSYGSTYQTLLVRDADGVRLGVTTARNRGKLRRAIEKADVGASTPHGLGSPHTAPVTRARRSRTHSWRTASCQCRTNARMSSRPSGSSVCAVKPCAASQSSGTGGRPRGHDIPRPRKRGGQPLQPLLRAAAQPRRHLIDTVQEHQRPPASEELLGPPFRSTQRHAGG